MRRAFALAVLVIAMAVGQSNVTAAGPLVGTGESPPPTTTVPATAAPTTTTLLDNPFLPEEANIGDCVSALPRPECGSKARGGWRQGLVFGAVAMAIAVVGFRVVVAVRRRDRSAGAPT